ncbi:MAG: tetratricopeptide repeat protein, partial [Desulfobacterales bacterium]
EYEKSRRCFESIIRLSPDNPLGYIGIGQLSMFEKKSDAAEEYLQKALDRKPFLVEALSSLVLVYTRQGNLAAAFNACDKQLARLEDSRRATAVIYNLKGSLYLEQKNSHKAEAQFKAAQQADPNYLPSYYALARLYLADDQEENAIKQFKGVLKQDPDQTSPHMLLGIIYESQGDPVLAEKHYRAALEIKTDFAPAANNLAYLLADQNRDLSEAFDLAIKAKQVNPADPAISDTLGLVYYKKGLYDYAVGELTAAAEKLPDNAVVRYHLGMAYLKKGDGDKARSELEKALSLDTSFKGAEEAREALAALQ